MAGWPLQDGLCSSFPVLVATAEARCCFSEDLGPPEPMEEGRHDWNINEVTWDRHEMRTEWRGDRSPEQSAGASSAQQVGLLA